MTTDNAALRQFIMLFFNDDELEDLCADYFADVAQEFTTGMTKSQKVRLLIGHVDRRGRREHLLAALARERPGHFTEQLGRAPVPVAAPPAAPARDPRRVFISHAHQDAATARRLAADLAAAGRPVWIAPDSILPGEQWVDAIGRGLEMSGVFVLLLSPEAVASNWVRYETSLAIVLEKRGRMDIVPLDWQECEPPITWQGYQYLPFRYYNDDLAALLTRLDGRAVEHDRRIHEKTGIELISIPAGPFLYGPDESTIDLSEFWIGRGPVTNTQYARFVKATGYHTTAEREDYASIWTKGERKQIKGANWRHPYGPESSVDGKDNHPVVQVSWDDAKAFCDWSGLLLPTEQQWEKAARGTDGRIWPWGNNPPTESHSNYANNVGNTTPITKYSPKGDSPYGCSDMAGNVWEWTSSLYKKYPQSYPERVLCGGSWLNSDQNIRTLFRSSLSMRQRVSFVGFRVVELLSNPGF